ncbi:MAG: hypothetical protein COA84_13490 [Robiginitomaculum sp.]|nr:MAG: hypothetical protein COA84_13490 [Robiginitomaculum sp.]
MWKYQNKEFTSDDIGDYIGFVYVIENVNNGKKYVGKKLFKSTRKLPPLKGKKRARKKVVETDWMTYYGSSVETMALVKAEGPGCFKREILHLCHMKGELSYQELVEQVERKVLLRDDYYNGIINCRINHKHVKKLWENNS